MRKVYLIVAFCQRSVQIHYIIHPSSFYLGVGKVHISKRLMFKSGYSINKTKLFYLFAAVLERAIFEGLPCLTEALL